MAYNLLCTESLKSNGVDLVDSLIRCSPVVSLVANGFIILVNMNTIIITLVIVLLLIVAFFALKGEPYQLGYIAYWNKQSLDDNPYVVHSLQYAKSLFS